MGPKHVTDDWMMDRLDLIWAAHTAAFAQLLIELRSAFDGDLDALLILAAVSVGTDGSDWHSTLLGDGGNGDMASTPTNTQSISSISGIPRESVRRKLYSLERKGWVTRDAEGNWRPTAEAAIDLRPATKATFRYLQTVFSAALEEARPPAPNRS